MATIADAIRRAQKDPAFAKDFAEHPEKFATEFQLTPQIIDKVKAAGAHFAPNAAMGVRGHETKREGDFHYYG
ncbi:MAG TPA: hypothetical protein PKE31_13285 [Pseudomonadota bacterium]|jgi:hypothetical protein|nr:hypothetical protein [Pseudomonadota bacterium]